MNHIGTRRRAGAAGGTAHACEGYASLLNEAAVRGDWRLLRAGVQAWPASCVKRKGSDGAKRAAGLL